MAENRPSIEAEPAGPDTNVDRGLSRIEAEDIASAPKGTAGFKNYVTKGGRIFGVNVGSLLLLAGAAILKTVELSFRLMQGIIENPKNPEKWIEPLKKSFKKEKKEEK